ncbi:Asp-tRNA(Asn)/Glu-tRNA(Gln) amidotransferase subunit GatA [Candidatus Dependentiae bacterium]|nr:Asp-tRNA(Asn)/Glu-tRNA(Gln) amidotransferase subunit GatA [Candidatus Dependentiae bacterium]
MDRSNLAFATIEQLQTMLAKKEISVRELWQYFRNRFTQYDNNIGSALEIFDEASMAAQLPTSGTGSLYGIPGLIKDNITQQGRATTCGSKILQGYRATYDATAVARLKAAGAISIGRANMDEFAMGSSNETSSYFPCRNPWDLTKVPGGSSGGSAAAVAAGFVPWALGSETGGSVRQPAALCGIIGLKPTYGLISRYGLVAYASSLDQIGFFARTTKDCAKVFSVVAGHDAHDSTSLPQPTIDYTKELDGTIPAGLTIGVVENTLYIDGVAQEVQQGVEEFCAVLTKLGATVKRIKIPSLDYAAACYFIMSRAEAASNLSRFDGVKYGLRVDDDAGLNAMYNATRHDGFGANVRRRILIGNYVLSSGYADRYYVNARKTQARMTDEINAAFAAVNLLVVPTAPGTAFSLNAFDADPLQMDLQDYFTCFANLTGVPGISLPCGFMNKMPIGVQLIGPRLSEQLLFRVADAYERVTQWHTEHPSLG